MPPSLVITPPAAAGGGSPISNPEVAYVRTNGNDSIAEIGNPARPFLTGTAAFAALKALHGDPGLPHSFDFGVGTFPLTLTYEVEAEANYNMFLRGCGANATQVVFTVSGPATRASDGLDRSGTKAANGSFPGDNGANGLPGGDGSSGETMTINLNLYSDDSVLVSFATTPQSGGNGGRGQEGGNGAGGDPGAEPPVAEGSGGNGGAGGAGGAGGDVDGIIKASNCHVSCTSVTGGSGGSGELEGRDGQSGLPDAGAAPDPTDFGPNGSQGSVTVTWDLSLCHVEDDEELYAIPIGNFKNGTFINS